MSGQDSTSDRDLVDRVRQIDELCDRFEEELRNGRRPTIEDFLRAEEIDFDAADSDLMRELARVESAYPHAAADLGETRSGSGSPRVSAGRYELDEEIARGGMGIVYRARDLVLDREVGLKTLLHVPARGNVIAKRFRDEARITGQLQHPNIPPVHDLGTLPDGRPFLAMKFMKGRTLDALLKARIDPANEPGRYLAIFEQIAQGVAYAHAHRVVHRDLKPLNVMVGAFGEVQVMDWGLAKVLADASAKTLPTSETETYALTEIRSVRDASEATRDGSVFGTPAYMPREQAIGAVDQIDTRSDVFSLGGILCTILTSRPPYVGANAETTRQLAASAKLDSALARLDACGAEPELIALCKRCLSPERDDRPDDAGAVAKAVAALRAEAERRARQAELDRVKAEGERATAEARAEEEAKTRHVAEEKAIEQRKKRRSQLLLLGAVALLLSGSGAFAWWRDYQANERKLTEAGLIGGRNAEARIKEQQAQQGVDTSLKLAVDLRKQYKFKAVGAAVAQALELAKGGAPERLPEMEQARRDLEFVVRLDDIRYRKWVWIVEENLNGSFNTKIAAPEYRKAFAEFGLDLTTLTPTEAVQRIAASAVKAELVAAVDDWALYEPDSAISNRLLQIARETDPGPWTDRLRDPGVRTDKAAVAKLALEADPTGTSSAAFSVLAELMIREGQDPAAVLSRARLAHPTDFQLAFVLGLWHTENSKDGQEIGPYEAARALRPDNVAIWSNLGNALHIKGDLEGAIDAYKEAIKLDPKFTAAYFNLGLALAKNDFDGAIDAFKEAIKLDPKYAPAHDRLGNALHRKKDLDGAITAYMEAIRVDPKYAPAHCNLGIVLAAKGKIDGAIAAYREAIRLDPKYTPAHCNLGIVLAAKGKIDGAIAAYREAIRLDPKYAPAHVNLGNALYRTKDLDGAITAYMEAIRLDPKYTPAHCNLGIVLAAKGKIDGAIAAYKEAVRLDPKDSSAHSNLGASLHRLNDLDGAIAAYKEAIKHDPKYVFAHYNLGAALSDQGNFDEAIDAFKQVIKLDPRYAKAYCNLGDSLRAKGKIDEAITVFRQAINLEPKNAQAHDTLGTLLTDKDLDGAIIEHKLAVELDPKFAIAHYNLGNRLQDKKDLNGAITEYKLTIELDPKYAPAHTNLGFLYLNQKKHAEAMACALAAIEADPKLPNAHILLSIVLEQRGDIPGARAALTKAIMLDKRFAPLMAKLPPVAVAPMPRAKTDP